MQYKLLLLTLISALSSSVVLAQDRRVRTAPKVDTLSIVKKKKAVIAAAPALPIAINMPKAMVVKPKVYKPVPLAHEKAYYGPMSEYVGKYVEKYLSAHNRTLNVVQDRSNKQFPLMDNVLQKHEIPKELKYLAVIESALNNNAVSKVGAVGPWQFMAPTARLMGLTVNGKRDDRKDWYKSTNAAAKYLTTLYDDLNDWLLVVAAYNSGPTPVKRAMERTGSSNFWDIKKYLPKETQGHVLAFIATATIFEKMGKFIGNTLPEDFDLTVDSATNAVAIKPKKPLFTPEELQNMAIVVLSEPMSMDLMVHELAMDRKVLDKWNPDYELFEYNTYSSETYKLRIPKDKLEQFVEMKEFLNKKSKQVFSAQNM